mmetsp:Transcript_79134/g.211463  ORF Transcript_79134/g.211463 Transcript_79134/m.211463 type:complete len:261 (+) Transcript_79134:3-785(+)
MTSCGVAFNAMETNNTRLTPTIDCADRKAQKKLRACCTSGPSPRHGAVTPLAVNRTQSDTEAAAPAVTAFPASLAPATAPASPATARSAPRTPSPEPPASRTTSLSSPTSAATKGGGLRWRSKFHRGETTRGRPAASVIRSTPSNPHTLMHEGPRSTTTAGNPSPGPTGAASTIHLPCTKKDKTTSARDPDDNLGAVSSCTRCLEPQPLAGPDMVELWSTTHTPRLKRMKTLPGSLTAGSGLRQAHTGSRTPSYSNGNKM